GVPFDRRRTAIHEELATLLLGRGQKLLARGDRGDRGIQTRLGRGLRSARDGEPGENGTKNPCTNLRTPGHVIPLITRTLGGNAFVAYGLSSNAVKRKARDRFRERSGQALPTPPVRSGPPRPS